MQERVQAHRLGARPRLGVEDGEIDAPPGEAFDLVDAEAFVDPVGEERLGRRAMGAPSLTSRSTIASGSRPRLRWPAPPGRRPGQVAARTRIGDVTRASPDRRSGTAGARAPPVRPCRRAGCAGRVRRRGCPRLVPGPPALAEASGSHDHARPRDVPAGRTASRPVVSPSQQHTTRPGGRGPSHSASARGGSISGMTARPLCWPLPWPRGASARGGGASARAPHERWCAR